MSLDPSGYERRIPARAEDSDYTLREACTVVRVASSTMWRMLNKGDVVGYKTGGRMKITRESVDAFRERNIFQPKQNNAAP